MAASNQGVQGCLAGKQGSCLPSPVTLDGNNIESITASLAVRIVWAIIAVTGSQAIALTTHANLFMAMYVLTHSSLHMSVSQPYYFGDLFAAECQPGRRDLHISLDIPYSPAWQGLLQGCDC